MTDEILYSNQREAMKAAMIGARMAGGSVYVCRGEAIGCTNGDGRCGNCYAISPDDRLSVDEHLAAFVRRDA